MIIPAIDLLNEKIVRLYQGNYTEVLHYSYQLKDLIDLYSLNNIQRLHIVDLQAAMNPHNKQHRFIESLFQFINIPIQIGGGIRNDKDIEFFLKYDNTRVVIGSAATNNINEVKNWFKIYTGEKIVLALDIHIQENNKKLIYTHGWKKKSIFVLEELIEIFSEYGLKHILCTDISKDGTLHGPNCKLYNDMTKQFPHLCIQASGGIGSISDIIKVKQTKVNSVIIGRALLENKFTIKEAIECWQKE
ncbi:1-(5-phosphoribosyl)-5-[(5-phosphoribosylamino)methylideneamino] imidazole-4-carboxamide isomerase [Buchnera aphidicola (Thelaxes californica)]|uniref:1-(5-phosphoribosyl)-5-[(5-phosphoribosylamino)methylideneamino] imidazole-4-carboxamide isomerase n=1 Tax=Buchnera aphidicola (Thelaxes californica) TaxID=1315998 RepID=A0A4D6YC05_9GAMM|nr:1-(5-phosphoribosyl)-5-[(5-phosphoribosylamino)methylideneamino] imidazole-4-carboxamide isomerase [Buchnera aphidicola]QCI26642.1 1-(5-phosphoribosyl)-5-[(5-phosphoribosylamino)methylideneamino] imidazole-4-carboxamide isomerase [Buchnera aphidicola (Thelaxes californica)]